MAQTPKIILPYKPEYTGHRDEARHRREVREWLRQRVFIQTHHQPFPEPHAEDEIKSKAASVGGLFSFQTDPPPRNVSANADAVPAPFIFIQSDRFLYSKRPFQPRSGASMIA